MSDEIQLVRPTIGELHRNWAKHFVGTIVRTTDGTIQFASRRPFAFDGWAAAGSGADVVGGSDTIVAVKASRVLSAQLELA